MHKILQIFKMFLLYKGIKILANYYKKLHCKLNQDWERKLLTSPHGCESARLCSRMLHVCIVAAVLAQGCVHAPSGRGCYYQWSSHCVTVKQFPVLLLHWPFCLSPCVCSPSLSLQRCWIQQKTWPTWLTDTVASSPRLLAPSSLEFIKVRWI